METICAAQFISLFYFRRSSCGEVLKQIIIGPVFESSPLAEGMVGAVANLQHRFSLGVLKPAFSHVHVHLGVPNYLEGECRMS